MNYLIIIGAALLGCIVALIISYFLPKEKIRSQNQTIIEEEQQAQLRLKDLEKEYTIASNEYNNKLKEQLDQIEIEKHNWELQKNNANLELVQETQNLKLEVRGLEDQKKATQNSILELEKSFQQLSKQADEAAEKFKEQAIALANKEIDEAKAKSQKELLETTNSYKEEYKKVLQDSAINFTTKIEEYKNIIQMYNNQLTELQSKVSAAVASNKRAELEKNKKNYYRLILSETDIEEIKKIRSIEPYLRDKEPLNKVIYKVYYEKPYTDLVGRVIGQKEKTGIYKITNLINGMCYIGQATSVGERWRQHIRRGVGADAPTKNKLYPAMLEYGAENFTFELIEECKPIELNDREKYWTDYFHAQDFGYVVRKG